jgi:exopolysaccharide biosynthesis polyprenyl glycosylphosphotransferase
VLLTVSLVVLSRSHAERSTLETQGVAWYCTALAGSVSTLTILLLCVGAFFGYSASDVAVFGVLLGGFLVGLHTVTWTVLVLLRRGGIGLHNALVVGEGAVAQTVMKKLTDYPEAGLRPAGVVTLTGAEELTEGGGTGVEPDELPALIELEGVDQLLIVPERHVNDELVQCLEACAGLDLHIAVLPPLADLFINPRQVSQVGGLPLLPVGKPTLLRPPVRPGKRLFDIVVSALLLLLVAPVLGVVALAVKLEDRGPVIFRQRRIGFGGRPFEICKFRSMQVGAERLVAPLAAHNVTDGLLFKMVNDPRVTRVGAIIRRLSVDELPQLWNVLKGDMSLVGPRPLAADASDFSVMDGRRHCVLPGITGYWQVTGGNGLTYQEMVKLDLAYIQNWSLWLDLRLLVKTVPALVHRSAPS